MSSSFWRTAASSWSLILHARKGIGARCCKATRSHTDCAGLCIMAVDAYVSVLVSAEGGLCISKGSQYTCWCSCSCWYFCHNKRPPTAKAAPATTLPNNTGHIDWRSMIAGTGFTETLLQVYQHESIKSPTAAIAVSGQQAKGY